MKDQLNTLLENSARFNRIEYWMVIGIYVFMMFVFITDATETYSDLHAPNKGAFDRVNHSFGFYRNYFIPVLFQITIIFFAFMLLNFRMVPKLILEEALRRNVFLTAVIFLLATVLFSVTRTFSKEHFFNEYTTGKEAYWAIFQGSLLSVTWMMLTFLMYTAIKYMGLYLWYHAEQIQEDYKFLRKEILAAFALWIFSMFLLVLGEAEGELIVFWGIFIPTALVLYTWSHHSLIPSSLGKKRALGRYLVKVAFICIGFFIVAALLLLPTVRDEDAAFSFAVLNAFFQFIFTAPLSWFVFKRQMRGSEEIYFLRKELGQTYANFDFLRSQINPHFLFNALNTIYGTAIQEKAERTSEGIEKLGDMMRFMLQENMQEKISLSREIDYLNNYIDLQKLRTDPNPNIRIDVAIDMPVMGVQIAPMLLIPFVENAFKHGISFREPSHIGIALEVKENTLYFDVHNSKHPSKESDPEKDKNGIGLNNVKQRLQLVYSNRHELVIRETAKEFFVHLTIELA